MDRLTQLQDTLDDLLTQMYASLNYIQQKHPYGEFEGQYKSADLVNFTSKPSNRANGNSSNSALSTAASTEANGTAKANSDKKDEKKQEDEEKKADGAPVHIPDEPDVFESTMREMARSLILQEQKAEILINSMPGIGHSEEKQKAKMAALMEELKQVEGERAKAEVERERMIDTLGDVIVDVHRVR